MNMGDHTTAGDGGGLDERVQLLVTADGQLEMAGGDALHLQILRCIPRQLEHFRGKVLEDGRGIDCCRRADSVLVRHALLEEAVDSADGELQACLGRPAHHLLGLRRGGGLLRRGLVLSLRSVLVLCGGGCLLRCLIEQNRI